MKIQCDVCERAEAAVLCCADEAALCWACDQVIHAANKLAGKHQRVPLLTPTPHLPNCDICQEKAGYFFCLEDRALLCRQCDVSIHTATPYVRAHQRFLLTGVKVSPAGGPPVETSSPPLQGICSEYSLKKCGEVVGAEEYGGVAPEMRPHWPLDEILVVGSHGFEFSLMGSSSRDSSQ